MSRIIGFENEGSVETGEEKSFVTSRDGIDGREWWRSKFPYENDVAREVIYWWNMYKI